MAIVQDFNNNQQNPQQSGGGNGQQQQPPTYSTSGTAAPSTGGGGSGPNASAAPTVGQGTSSNTNPTNSGQFTNLSSYLNANKSYNAAGGGLAGQINNSIQNQANTVNTGVNQAQDTFNTQSQQGRNTQNDALNSQVYNNATSVVNDPNQMASWQRELTGGYTGPTQLDSGGALLGQAQNLQNTANLTSTDTGRQSLLSRLYGQPGYSSGQQSLDNLMLQGNPNQLSSLQGARNTASNLLGNYNNTANADLGTVQQYQTEAARTNQQASDLLGQVTKNFDQSAQQAATNAQAAAQNQYNQVQQSLAAGNLSADWSQALGYDPKSAFGVNAAQYLSQGPTATQYNTLSPQMAAQANALSALAGNAGNVNASTRGILQGYAGNAGQAGSFNPNNITLSPGYASAVGQAQGQYNAALASLGIQAPQLAQDYQGLMTGSQGESQAQLQAALDAIVANNAPSPQEALNNPTGRSAQDLGNQAQVGEANPNADIIAAQSQAAQDAYNTANTNAAADKRTLAALNAILQQYGQSIPS